MPSAVNAGGVITRRPGVYSDPDFSANSGRQSALKRLGIVGNFPFLEQAVPTLVTSQRSMTALSPTNQDLATAASIAYRPGNDPEIGFGTSEIYMISAAESTQAGVTLVDGAAGPALQIDSIAWGLDGNRVEYDVATTGDGTTFIFSRDGIVETYRNILGVNLFSAQYTGTFFATAATVASSFNGTDFRIAASKAALAIGTSNINEDWDGVVSITPSVEPSGAEVYTATINGTNKETGAAATPQVLTWINGDGAVLKSTAIEFSAITSIVFSKTLAVTTPTFTVSGYICNADQDRFPFVKQLTDFLATQGNLTLTNLSGLRTTVALESLDVRASTTIIGAAVTFTNTLSQIVSALSVSGLVSVTAITGGGVPADASGFLVGGTQTAPGSGDWSTALEGARPYPISVFALLTSDETGQLALVDHCRYMWGAGRHECQGWTGTAVGATKTTVKARALLLNCFQVSLVAQEARIRLNSGAQKWVAPYWYALMHAAAQCSVDFCVPLTWKRLAALAVRTGTTTWSAENDVNEMIAAMITITTRDPNGLKIERSLSTHLSDDDPARTAPSAVESIATYIIRNRNALNATIGSPAVATTTGRIRSRVLSISEQAQKDGIISRFDQESIGAEQVGDTFVVTAAIAPVYETTFIVFRPSILPISFAA